MRLELNHLQRTFLMSYCAEGRFSVPRYRRCGEQTALDWCNNWQTISKQISNYLICQSLGATARTDMGLWLGFGEIHSKLLPWHMRSVGSTSGAGSHRHNSSLPRCRSEALCITSPLQDMTVSIEGCRPWRYAPHSVIHNARLLDQSTAEPRTVTASILSCPLEDSCQYKEDAIGRSPWEQWCFSRFVTLVSRLGKWSLTTSHCRAAN